MNAPEDRIIEKTNVGGGGVEVSTVFLGLDHNFSGIGPAFLFETMVFGGDRNGDMRRYATMGEAKTGHFELVESLKAESI